MDRNGLSDRGQSLVADSITVSAAQVYGTHTMKGVPEPSELPVQPETSRATARSLSLPYVAAMGKFTTARSAISAIDERKPDLPTIKTHLLLYFCQGHHLANFGEPLFEDPLLATEEGVTVQTTSDDSPPYSSSRPLNTISVALARYGNLTSADLRTLVQASQPWQLAMKSAASQRIEPEWLRDWFSRPEEVDDPSGERLTRVDAEDAAAFLRSRSSR